MPSEVKFEAPGPGPWELDSTHMTRPLSRFAEASFKRGFLHGFPLGTARFGLLLSHMKPAIVNGFFYMQPVPFGAPEGAAGPPPKPVLWLLTRLHPKMRARIAQSKRAFENKLWREDLKHWDEVKKPEAIAAHKAIQAVDPAKLSDEELLEHVERCEKHVGDMVGLHHEFTATCVVAAGDYLAQASAWTGASPRELLAPLRGSSPISKGFAAEELMRVGNAVRSSPRAQALLASGHDPTRVLDELRSMEGDVGASTSAYLDAVRFRSLGYDVGDRTAGEMPELLLKAVRAASSETRGSDDDSADRAAKSLRERVPAEHRESFDELLAEARLVNRLRDERGQFSDGWAGGLARRALLEVGRRLVEKKKLEAADHAVDLTLDEIREAFAGKGPSLEEVKRRVEWRNTKTVADAPPWLNAPPGAPPPTEILPKAAQRGARAVDVMLTNLFKESEAKSSGKVVRGTGVNSGSYEGTARIVGSNNEFAKIQQGDVLIAQSTSPYFNVVLPLLGAIVTDRGGQLCHAAIVAREYGIPGVVGTRDATQVIPDGARVRVDGEKGEVTLLGQPS